MTDDTRTMRAARGRYKLIEEIGSGATATVWRARDPRTGREVAVKRFHRHVLRDPVARRRIEEAAAAASRVKHPAIVSAIERIGGRDDLALVFPYFEGTTLAQRLASGAPMAPRDAASITLEIADALATAHDAGVAHRDVKPANILVGADGQARLLDFGISRAFDEGDHAELTGAGLAIGTLPYMAPEQLCAAPPTPASDVYGLGAVLYEMLAGRRPYAAASPVALANEQSLPPARIDGVPVPLADIALEAMSADAAARPSAAGLARGLRAWLDGRADSAAPTVSVLAAKPLATTPSRTNPAAALIAIGLVAVLLVAALPFVFLGLGSTPAFTSVAASPVPAAPATPSAPQEPSVVGAANNNPPNRPSGDKPDKKQHDKKKHR
ncbi:MAG: serine/threonine-protein kinase [Chloroflexota bacterium]